MKLQRIAAIMNRSDCDIVIVGAGIGMYLPEIGLKLITRSRVQKIFLSLPDALDRLKNKIGTGIVVLGTVNDGKVGLIAGVTKDLTDRFNAGELVNHVAMQVGGKGGGRPDMARAGGSNPEALPEALGSVEGFVRGLLG